MKTLILASVLTGLISTPAMAQFGRSDNPNMRNFYMARQQVQIFDEAPQVNDMRTNPAAAAQGPAPAVTGPQALPRAGFNTNMGGYMGSNPGVGLPQVNNGVPKLPPAGPNLSGKQAQSGGTIKAKAPPKPKAPVVAKSYKPYATFPASGNAPSGGGGSMLNSSTSVSGSVLHWNKRRPGY